MGKLNSELLDLYRFIDENYNPQAKDIYYSLELLSSSIDDTKNAMTKTIQNNASDFSKVNLLSSYAEKIKNIEDLIDDYLDSFSINSSDDEDKIEEDEDEKREIPNYKDYEVDQEIPHLLTESFTYKKICGFFINNIRYNINDWKSALVKLCEILISIDMGKFRNLVSSNQFSGKKRNYFAFDGKGKYYKRVGNTNIYVWTCHSANMICVIMRKLLREYNIPINSMYIYLRADYTPIHNALPEIENEHIADEEMKIGKFVRESMRKLSNQNYNFDKETLSNLTNDQSTKRIFGIGTAFLKEVKSGDDISKMTKDTKGYNRYWKEVFRFNNKDYLIVSQWTKSNSERFHNWFNRLQKA